jgi:LexA-binding, inner membrane-associated putative hydrolase
VRPQAHCAASLLVWSAAPAPLHEAPLCVLAGNLPDFDRNVAKALGVRRRDHHRWISHSFVGWAPPTALALVAARGTRAEPAVRRATVSLWLHLVLDTYADGLAWLWPLSEEKIGLFRSDPGVVDRGWRTPAPRGGRMWRAEAAMWAAAAANVFGRLAR